jgi:hypothetical protein
MPTSEPTPAPRSAPTETSDPGDAGWLTGIPRHWIARLADDGTIRLEGESGTLIAARGAGDCDQLSYPPPVGDLAYGDLDARASDPWSLKVGYVVESGTHVYCRALGEREVMVVVVPADVAATEVLLTLAPA